MAAGGRQKARVSKRGGKAKAPTLGKEKKLKAAKGKKEEDDEDDFLGVGGDGADEALALRGSDDEDGDDGEDDDDDQPQDGDAGSDAGGEAPGPGAGDEKGFHGSKMLARVVAGQQPADVGAIKQRIHDSAALLSNWRKARQLGDKRTREEVLASLVGDCSTYYGYSEELAEYFLRMFSPEQAVQLFEANEKSRPLTIRTNSLKARRTSLMQSLTARKVQVDPVGPWTKVGLKVYESAVPIGATPEYLGGQYMIQSASSFIPVMALAPQQNETILDMAAAPGGKTTYIGQLMRNTGTLFANDLRKERCKALVANCHRMGLTNVIVTNLDGRKLGNMLPKLDRALLDAPCSGSGIVARDPSVKVKRGTKDFEESSRIQKELLTTAIDLVDAGSKTGGYIVYSTCSISVEENEAVVEHALRTRSVELVSFSSAVNFGVEGLTRFRERRFHPSMSMCRRYYPHVHNMDGFFVAKLKKTSNKVPERAKKDRSKGADHVKVWGEEHWTPDLMESVVDFHPPDAKGPGRALNKRERKRIKRQAQLAAKAKAASAVEAAKPEPEEEPAPPAQAGGKKKVLKRRKVAAAEAAGGEASEAAAEPPKTLAKTKRKRKAEGGEEATPAPAAEGQAAEAAEKPSAPPRKKKRKKAD